MSDTFVLLTLSGYLGMMRYCNACLLYSDSLDKDQLRLLKKVSKDHLKIWQRKKSIAGSTAAAEADKQKDPSVYVREEVRASMVQHHKAVLAAKTIVDARDAMEKLVSVLNKERQEDYFVHRVEQLKGKQVNAAPQGAEGDAVQGFSVTLSHGLSMALFVTGAGLSIAKERGLPPDSPFETATSIFREFARSGVYYSTAHDHSEKIKRIQKKASLSSR